MLDNKPTSEAKPQLRGSKDSGSVHTNPETGSQPEGFVTKARVVSGHPLIVDAARKAVLQWRYAPPRFKDEPVEVITQTSVTFTLPPADATPKEITTVSD